MAVTRSSADPLANMVSSLIIGNHRNNLDLLLVSYKSKFEKVEC
jgi:hypothetical protein